MVKEDVTFVGDFKSISISSTLFICTVTELSLWSISFPSCRPFVLVVGSTESLHLISGTILEDGVLLFS